MRWLLSLGLTLAVGCSFSGGAASGDGDGDGDGDAGIDAGIDAPADAEPPTPWADADYDSRRPVTVDNTGGAALDGFPVPVALQLGSGAVGSGGAGLLIVDDGNTPLVHEIERVDQNGVGVVWVRLDIAADAVTRFWLYYDQTTARSDPSDSAAVFAGFASVYHFSDNYNNDIDDVVSGDDLDDRSNIDNNDQVAGRFVIGADFNAPDTERAGRTAVSAAHVLADDAALMFEAWLLADNLDDATRFAILDTVDGGDGVLVEVADNSFLRATVSLDADYDVPGDVAVDNNVWHHVALVVDRAQGFARLYLDGTLDGENTNIPATGDQNGGLLSVGGRNASDRFFTGRVDEVRVGPARPEPWIAATAAGTNLAVVGAEESQPPN